MPGLIAWSPVVIVLSPPGLRLARRLFAAQPNGTAIFGPSCIVGACGGRAEGVVMRAEGEPLPPGSFPTAEPGLFGFTGSIRRLFPALWARTDAIVAVMSLAQLVRLAGPLAGDTRSGSGPAVVAVDDAGQFAISVAGGQGRAADALAHQVAAILGAVPIITTPPPRTQYPRYDGGEGGPKPGA